MYTRARTYSLLIITFLLLASLASAQSGRRATLRGNVIDDSTNTPISGANVFLANTTLGASADSNGAYVIRNVPPGTYDIVASCIGYTIGISRIIVSSVDSATIDIRLSQSEICVGVVEVTATRSKEWKENLELFTKLLLGSTRVASQCLLVNPEVVRFSTGMPGRLQAETEKELLIDNSAFGYRLHALLRTFFFDGRLLTVECMIRFEEQKSTDSGVESEWMEKRDDAYFGSVRHFYKALINDELSSEGFAMFTVESRDELRKSIPRITVKRSEVLGKSGSDAWLLTVPNYLVVSYDRKQIEMEPGQFYGDIRDFRDRSFDTRKFRAQIGILVLSKGSLVLDTQGHVLDRLGFRVLGDWGKDGLANELPLDFQPKTRR